MYLAGLLGDGFAFAEILDFVILVVSGLAGGLSLGRPRLVAVSLDHGV